MTQQLTPPPELVQQWANDSVPYRANATGKDWEIAFAMRAAQWGADQELEACCQALYDRYDSVRRATGFPGSDMSDWLRAARRPKPPSLKERSLKHLEVMERDRHYLPEILQDLRRAVEQLND